MTNEAKPKKEFGKLTADQLLTVLQWQPQIELAQSAIQETLLGDRDHIPSFAPKGFRWSGAYELTLEEHLARIVILIGKADFIASAAKSADPAAALIADVDEYQRVESIQFGIVGEAHGLPFLIGLLWALKGAMSARLYDKLFELVTISRKDYLLTLWQQAGRQADESVWRLEFQLRRAVLKEMGIGDVGSLLANLDAIWAYGSGNWLLLKVPNPSDSNQSRWLLHPLWELLQSVKFGDQRQPALARSRSASLPSDKWLFTNGLGPFSSYMAREGLASFEDAFPRFFADASEFHEKQGSSVERYAEVKARLKGRKFGTINNRPETVMDLEQQASDAEHYRRIKDGE